MTMELARQLRDQDCPLPTLAGPAIKLLFAHIESLEDAARAVVPDGWKLVPIEPTPEQIAATAVAVWPTASIKDIEQAMIAARLVLTSHMDAAPGASLDSIAAAIATMFPAYRAMINAAPQPEVKEPADG
jgi:hypothetical protein